MKPLASRMNVLTGEGALTVYLRAKELEREGRSIIHLELGEPDFHAAEPVVAAHRKAVRDGKDRYCPMAGVPGTERRKLPISPARAPSLFRRRM
jgi:aspartate/methionine/tyrosine aminotransferase